MLNLTAPYRFIPLNKKVFIPSWWNLVSQDIPFSDAEDGSIQLEFKICTPILVGGMNSASDAKSPLKCKIGGKEKYFIPGTSWKGMVRSVLEVLSYSKMQQYDDSTFGYRDLGDTMKVKYNVQMKENEYAGWLYRDAADRYYIIPSSFGTIAISELRSMSLSQGRYKEQGNIIEKLSAFGGEYPKIKGGKYLAFSGFMQGKAHEYIFDDPAQSREKPIEVTKEVAEKFRSVYRNSPYNEEKNGKRFIDDWLADEYDPKNRHGIRHSTPLPIFYHTSNEKKDGAVSHIGLTKCYRLPYNYSVGQCVKQVVPEGRDLAECIFGYIDDKQDRQGMQDCLKGRVLFEATWMDVPNKPLVSTKGVLAQPKASYYPFYLKQKGDKLQSYLDSAEIAGRKAYAVHKENTTAELPQGNGNDNVASKLEFIPAGQTIKLVVHFHNLRAVELGALLSALTFHNTRGLFYNMGMAKGYGYGKLQLNFDTIRLQGTKHENSDYYLSMFEAEMTRFEPQWKDSEPIKALLGVYSGQLSHTELHVMGLNERINTANDKQKKLWAVGKDATENKNPKNLAIPSIAPRSIKNEESVFESYKRNAIWNEAQLKLSQAEELYRKIEAECTKPEYVNYAAEQIQRIELMLSELLQKAQNLENADDLDGAIEAYKQYEKCAEKSVDIDRIENKRRSKEQEKIEGVHRAAEAAEREGQYKEAISLYEKYAQASGIPQDDAIARCRRRMEQLDKSIDDVFVVSSIGAFLSSVYKYVKARIGIVSEADLSKIEAKIQELKGEDPKRWGNEKEWNKQFAKMKGLPEQLKTSILSAVEK